MYGDHPRLCVCYAFLHYCTYFNVTLWTVWGYPFVVPLEIIFKPVHRFCCHGNIRVHTRLHCKCVKRNVSECLYSLHCWFWNVTVVHILLCHIISYIKYQRFISNVWHDTLGYDKCNEEIRLQTISLNEFLPMMAQKMRNKVIFNQSVPQILSKFDRKKVVNRKWLNICDVYQ